MQHLDEGIIHAWIDGELPPDEAARVEAHAASCASCGAMVAEARGLVAASSRIVSALDSLPRAQRGVSNGMLPAFGARKTPRRWMTAKVTSAIAATLVIAAGTVMTVRGRVEPPVPAPKAGSPASPMAAAKHDTQLGSVAAPTAMPAPLARPVSPTTAQPMATARIDRVAKVAAALQTDRAQSPLSLLSTGRVAGAVAGAGGAGAVAEAKAAPRRNADFGRNLASVVTLGLQRSFVGCYEVNESTDVLPKRFALRTDSARAGVDGLYEVRYVDSTGVMDGRMVDAGWMETGGRAVIRTSRLGDILTILNTGNGIVAQSPLGPRTVKVTACR
jgi:hypothetical protein